MYYRFMLDNGKQILMGQHTIEGVGHCSGWYSRQIVRGIAYAEYDASTNELSVFNAGKLVEFDTSHTWKWRVIGRDWNETLETFTGVLETFVKDSAT